jgi:two-component sensor histidine kinase
VTLHDIVAGELEKYGSGDSGRIFIDGPAVSFKAAGALALGMMFHELASDAGRRGALSNAKGRVWVTWDIADDRRRMLHIDWRESGGPRLKRPRRAAPGTEMVDRELKAALRAAVTLDYAPAGLRARISIPLGAGSQRA